MTCGPVIRKDMNLHFDPNNEQDMKLLNSMAISNVQCDWSLIQKKLDENGTR